MDGYAIGERYTAVATYTGTTTSSYVKGYTVTADYTGTVSRIILNRVRYVAIFEGEPMQTPLAERTTAADTEAQTVAQFPWHYVLIPIGAVAVVGAGIGAALTIKRRGENEHGGTEEDAE